MEGAYEYAMLMWLFASACVRVCEEAFISERPSVPDSALHECKKCMKTGYRDKSYIMHFYISLCHTFGAQSDGR